jgi:RHS repeat-associated protein
MALPSVACKHSRLHSVRAHAHLLMLGAVIFLAGMLLLPSAAVATVLPEKFTENTTLTPDGNPYVGGNSTIESGVTLTVEPGVKFNVNTLTVKGTLKAEGSAEEPILFTGAEEKAAGEWERIKFEPGSGASVLDHVEAKFGSWLTSAGMIEVIGSSPTIKNSTFRKSGGHGIKVIKGGSPEIADSKFIENFKYAISYGAEATSSGEINIHGNSVEKGGGGITVEINSAASVAGQTLSSNTITGTGGYGVIYSGPDIPGDISQNTLSGNTSSKNQIWVEGTVAHTSTWTNGGSKLYFNNGVTIAPGATLTMKSGITALVQSSLTVKGTLKAEGSAEEPILFTGAEEKAAGEWERIKFEPGSGASVLDHVEAKFGSWLTSAGMIEVVGSSPTIKDSTFRKSGGYGIKVVKGGSPEIANNSFVENLKYAVSYGAESGNSGEINIHGNSVEKGGGGITASVNSAASVTGQTLSANTVTGTSAYGVIYSGPDIPGDISQNTLSGNTSSKNQIWVEGTVAHTSSWTNGGSKLYFNNGVTIASGATLTMNPGITAIVGQSLTVKGTLKAEGSAEEPILFTGPEEKAAGEWERIKFEAGSGASVLSHVEAKYGSWLTSAGMIEVVGSSPTIKDSTFRKSGGYGIKVTESGKPTIAWNRFRGNAKGISYSGTGNLAAPNNDWGCASGPSPAGCGDSATSNVKWQPAAQLPELAGHCRGQDSQCGEGADPVSLATGHLSYSHRDLLLTNKSRVPLEFTRAYSSGSSADTGLGPGWSQTGLGSATELASGAVLILRQDGRQDLFYKIESGYKAPPGVTGTLTKVEGAFQLTTLENTIYRFDTSGRIASITDDHSLKTTYGYDANGRLATITDPSAQTLTFSHNASNHITSIKDSTSREVKYTYSGAGDLATATDALGGITEYTYDSEHRLKTIKDPGGNVILKNTYDGQGRVVEQCDGLENFWKLEYKEDETIVTEPEGGKITFEFDGQDRVVSKTDQLGNTTTTNYDEAGNVDEIVKPGGAKWQFGHDAKGNLTSVIDPEESERSYEYDGQNRLTEFTDEREETWAYEWSEANDLKKITDPAEGETTTTYNASGQPLTVTDPDEHTTTFTYDTRGNRLTAKDALEHTTTFGYDSRNHLASRTAPGLKAEAFERNVLGDLLARTTPMGNKTKYAYDANGMPKQITDPAEGVWKIERNAMERPTAYVDPLGKETKLEYDGNLNAVKVTDRRGKETTYAYDLANQLTDVVRPEGGDWEFDYDARGNRIEAVEPRENATSYEYDLLDRMIEAAEPLAAVTSYEYDPSGNLISFTDPRENTTELAYDELGRPTELKQPLGKVTSFGYDGVGNRISRTTAEGTVDFDYDAANRLEEVSDGESTLRSFDYDAANRLTGATDAQADEIEIGHDEDGRVVSIDDGRGQTMARDYDSRGNVIEQADGRGTLEYEYDKLGRMISLTDPQSKVLDFDYDLEGNLTKAELPNGVVTANEFDNAGRLAETTSAKGETTLESLEYEYDPFGNRIGQVDRLSQETTYDYDALNRLIEFDPPGEGSTSYDYDPAGNRTEAGATTYGFNALNQLTSASNGTTYDYDNAGRLVEVDQGETSTTYDWNAIDELTSVDTGAQEIDYAYDAFGRQVLRDDGSTIRPTHYGDLSDLPILDTDAEGEPTMSYVQGPGGLVEQRAGEARSFPLRDAHGDITTLADGEGEVASRQTYDPWGAQLTGPSLEMGWLGAQQRRGDVATGLVQMGARPYSPALGSLISEDPVLGHVGIGMTIDRYLYALSNPLNRYDLNGRDVCLFGGCVGPDDVAAIGENIEGGLGIAEEGANAVGSAAGSAVDDAWDWTAPDRDWVGDRSRDFWKQNGDMLEDIYRFAGEHWEGCAKGAPPGAIAGGTIGSSLGPPGTAIGGAVGGAAGCGGVVGGEVLYGEQLR